VTETRTVVGRDGRAKAYRPLPVAERTAAFEAGIRAYAEGDFFEAHELLEPAWMGSPELGERAFLQGLIKLAAAYVHAVRGNPRGITRNLEGARDRLAEARTDGAPTAGVDLERLLHDIEARLADLAAHPDEVRLNPPTLHRSTK
jgi:predicted metal-dependent hydrolase